MSREKIMEIYTPLCGVGAAQSIQTMIRVLGGRTVDVSFTYNGYTSQHLGLLTLFPTQEISGVIDKIITSLTTIINKSS